MIVTNVEYSDSCVTIYLDTGQCFKVEYGSVPSSLLQKGVTIDHEAYEHLKSESKLYECKEKALSYISMRNRTEHDVMQYLLKKNFDAKVVQKVIALFKQQGLLNDYAYAVQYIEATRARKIVGDRMIKSKLIVKGVDKSVIKKALQSTRHKEPTMEEIVNLATRKYEKVKNSANPKAKVASFLQQRGFDWDTIRKVIRQIGNDNTIENEEISDV